MSDTTSPQTGSPTVSATVGTVVRLVGASSAQLKHARRLLGDRATVVDASSEHRAADATVVEVTVDEHLVVDDAWLAALVDAAADSKGPVGGIAVDTDGRIVHAGALPTETGLRPFAHGETSSTAPLLGSSRFARLLPPFARSTAANVAGRPDDTPLGLLRPDIVAVSAAPIDHAVASGVVAHDRLLPGAVLVDGSTDSAELDREILAALGTTGPVMWRRSWNASPDPIDGVHEFDAAEHTADTLIAAFGVHRVLFLDDELLGDADALQHVLRAAPGLDAVALRGRVRPELATRCSRQLDLDDLADWSDAPTPAHTPRIATIAPTPTTAGLVSVVIPVHGLWELTSRCIDTLRSSTERPLEIVVVDDASPDETPRRLAERDDLVVVTNETNMGFPTSVNRGIAATSGELVVVLNNDTEPAAGWLDEMLDVLAIDDTLMVGPRSNRISGLQQVRLGPSLDEPDAAHRWAADWSNAHRGSSWRTDRLVGFALLVRRSTFVEHGGFDEGFGRGNFEDDELSQRLLAAGGDLRVADGAVILHHGSATFASLDTDYMTTLAEASRHHRPAATRHREPIACLVLSDGDVDATERTVWTVLGLSTRIVVAERGPVDALALRLARTARLGVEVLAADWTTADGAAAALEHLAGSETLFMCSAGEHLEVTDWGAARAELERADGHPLGVTVDLRREIRTVANDATALEHLGGPADRVAEHLRLRTEISLVPHEAPTNTPAPSSDSAASPMQTNDERSRDAAVELAVLVLSDGDPMAAHTTAESAAALTADVMILERAAMTGEQPGIVQVDWTDSDQLRAVVAMVDAARLLVLGAGELLVVDGPAWAADRCEPRLGDMAVAVGDAAEIRIAPCDEHLVDRVGAEQGDAPVSRGLRIIPAGLPHAELLSLRHPEIATPALLDAALHGEPSAAERLAEALVLDEEHRLLEQIRTERPVDWSADVADATVGVILAFDGPFDDVAALGDSLATLAHQSHDALRVLIITSPEVDAGFVTDVAERHAGSLQFDVVAHTGVDVDTDADARRARLHNLGATLVDADWVMLADLGDRFAPEHVATMLATAVADEAEYVHSLVAVGDHRGGTSIEMSADLCATTGSVGPVLFASEYRALQMRPTAVAIPERPSANRLERLRVLGLVEAVTDSVTVTRTPRIRRRGDAGAVADRSTTAPTGVALHLGCGPNHMDGWVNIDLEAEYEPDLQHDLSTGLPYADDSVDLVYSEHFFEHLPLAAGYALMQECHRVLRPGGVLRIAMPDLESTVHAYLGDWRAQAWVAAFPRIDTAARMLNIGMREWGHEYVYDLEDLTLRLRSIGFGDVRPAPWGVSRHAELQARETRADSILVVEATV